MKPLELNEKNLERMLDSLTEEEKKRIVLRPTEMVYSTSIVKAILDNAKPVRTKKRRK